ncbi:two-component sensor histidine kinase [Staphylococcus simulans]|uniref:sensor histidine kinase n=1 Tax=Staphylococcus simulans TaxID=1286 RepID=UPI000D0A5680|nr:ATP-binding protein [Staphylococcus simulans]AVO03195.1 two-component sensor histidine kinase [Staphylococcus simulans]AVO06150.1 two-component sensor histidine kinase [Staphylococcus simulans]AWG19743.1 two-component sensor histidine kinase [Staphylococcus simulans]AWI02691.1 two-component sensor histidine kinase [Staphylococcus simulans]PTJ00420.1 two-component sensor histidine kinase [Staphylococcus simulans]
MKSVPKLIGRFIGILLLSIFLLLVLNIFALFFISINQSPSHSPYTVAEDTADSLYKTDNGYTLDNTTLAFLQNENIWAILIDDNTKTVVWHTDNLPNAIPATYSLSDISTLTSGYIDGYPTYTGDAEGGLLVLGYPKDSYWKHLWPSWNYQFISHLPQTFLVVLLCNVLLIFVIYIWTTGKLTKSINPIVQGIRNLAARKQVQLKEKGVLSELAMNINQTSQILESQERELEKRETARVNWVAGVSHDIRTPLSIVMGYAGQLGDSSDLTSEERKKAMVILRQSEKMRNLINDLNLASKLEYNMQPLNQKKVNVVSLVRQVVVDFINNDIENNYPIEWKTDDKLSSCIIQAEEDLVKRAISNLVQNCINHNENGCTIYVSVHTTQSKCTITVEDDGIGTTDEHIEKLNKTTHYLIIDDATAEQRHGLGLLIVKQIVESHDGIMIIGHSRYAGFAVTLELPKE